MCNVRRKVSGTKLAATSQDFCPILVRLVADELLGCSANLPDKLNISVVVVQVAGEICEFFLHDNNVDSLIITIPPCEMTVKSAVFDAWDMRENFNRDSRVKPSLGLRVHVECSDHHVVMISESHQLTVVCFRHHDVPVPISLDEEGSCEVDHVLDTQFVLLGEVVHENLDARTVSRCLPDDEVFKILRKTDILIVVMSLIDLHQLSRESVVEGGDLVVVEEHVGS